MIIVVLLLLLFKSLLLFLRWSLEVKNFWAHIKNGLDWNYRVCKPIFLGACLLDHFNVLLPFFLRPPIHRSSFVNIKYVYFEKHFSLRDGRVSKKCLMHQIEETHGARSSGDANEIEVIFPYLQIQSQRHLEPRNYRLHEAAFANFICFVFVIWRSQFALKTNFTCFD